MNGEATRELTRAASTHGGGVSLRETAVLLEDATRCVCGAHAELCWRPPSHLLALSPHVIAGLPYYHVPRVRPPLALLDSNEPAAEAAGGKRRKSRAAARNLIFLEVFRRSKCIYRSSGSGWYPVDI